MLRAVEVQKTAKIERGHTMAYYTLGQAAKATGKSKGTIANRIAKGVISATKNDDGYWQIEVSELHRVYQPLSMQSVSNSDGVDRSKYPEINRLEVTVKVLQDALDDIRARLDSSEQERKAISERLNAFLSPPKPKKRSAWSLFGGEKAS